MASQFGAPELPQGVDTLKAKKLALRVEETLNKHGLIRAPKQLEPALVLVAPTNRDGGPPNVQHVHDGVLMPFITKGFDKTRPPIGICIKYTSEEARALLVKHNPQFSKH